MPGPVASSHGSRKTARECAGRSCELIQEQQCSLFRVVEHDALFAVYPNVPVQSGFIQGSRQDPAIRNRHAHAVPVKDQAEHRLHGRGRCRDQGSGIVHVGRSRLDHIPGRDALPVGDRFHISVFQIIRTSR